MPEKIILSIDSQILNSFEACPRLCYYKFVKKYSAAIKSAALDKGDLIHLMLKQHYEMLRSGIKYDAIPPAVVAGGEDCLVKLDAPVDILEEVIRTYQQYAAYYAGEYWNPQYIEEVFSKEIYEDESLVVLYEGKVDLVVQQGIVDHKSSARRGEPSAMSNQFMGYCWAFGMNNLIINKIGWQKTLEPKDKFERYTKSYPNEIIDEWKNHTIVVGKQLAADLHDQERMQQRYNMSSCDKFGGCLYEKVCLSVPEVRAWVLSNQFVQVEEWNPGKVLETK